MTPHLPPIGSYVRAVHISGLTPYGSYENRIGKLVDFTTHGDPIGNYLVRFPDHNFNVVCSEIEPSTRVDYDADWPEDDDAPAQPAPEPESAEDILAEAIANMNSDKLTAESDAYLAEGEMKTASAVLEAGNDHCLKWLRAELYNIEQMMNHEADRLATVQDRIKNFTETENAILDLIAARMDQLKGQGK